MYDNLGIHWASSIPAFLALACVPFPFLFYKYGETIRLKCRYAAEAAAALKELRSGGKTKKDQPEEEKRGVEKDVGEDSGQDGQNEDDKEVGVLNKTQLNKEGL
jgi:hypothetical protein